MARNVLTPEDILEGEIYARKQEVWRMERQAWEQQRERESRLNAVLERGRLDDQAQRLRASRKRDIDARIARALARR